MPPKTIELPKARGDLYRFEDLPALIAEALHPEHLYPADCLLSCTIWRGVGDEGTYWRCIPPEGQCCPSIHEIGDVAEWSIEEIELTPEERLHPDRSNWHHFRWHVQRLPGDLQPRWPDGSLIVEQVHTGNDLARDVFMKSEHDWYRTRLCVAANADLGDPARLLVLDSLGNDIDFRHGAALDGGYVHLDELNRWGALQQPARLFNVYSSSAMVQTVVTSGVNPAPAKRSESDRPGNISPNPENVVRGDWKSKVQAAAYEHWLTLRATGANPTVHGVVDFIAKWCRDNDVKTGSGVYPSGGYLRTHVLGGKHWTPPQHSVRDAQKCVAQAAQIAQASVDQSVQ